MNRYVYAAGFVLVLSFGAYAQETETVEELASPEEVASVTEAVARIGCTPAEVEKESENLFELDDAVCEIGQYDIKLDAEFSIISMTRDE